MLGSVLSGALGLVSMIYPSAGPVIAILEKVAPYIEEAAPIISAAVEEGPGAFEAVKQNAPHLADAINQIVSHINISPANLGNSDAATAENVTRAIFGFPQMTFEQELKWMNDTTASVGDPRMGG